MSQLIATICDQENTLRPLAAKAGADNKAILQRKRGALGDLGNTVNTLQSLKVDPLKPTALNKQVHLKKDEESKKVVAPISKVNGLKENRLQCRKPIRQESVLIQPTKLIVAPKVNTVLEETLKAPTVSKALGIYDPDEETKNNPQMVTEYIEDILAYLQGIEDDYPIAAKFLEGTKVSAKMRATLVNWLIDVHQNFSMGLDSLHLCVAIVDRYLQANKAVERNIFQLVGTAALLLAAKYEEIYYPDLSDFVYICDNAFTKKHLLQMEIDIFKKLDYKLGWPVSIYFLRRYSKVAAAKPEQHTLAKYILELALLEYNLAHIKPSIQAAAACCLSRAILTEVMDPAKIWTPTLVHYTKYKYSDFKAVLYEFAHLVANAQTSKKNVARDKYSASKYGKISLSFKLEGPLIRKLTTTSPTLSKK